MRNKFLLMMIMIMLVGVMTTGISNAEGGVVKPKSVADIDVLFSKAEDLNCLESKSEGCTGDIRRINIESQFSSSDVIDIIEEKYFSEEDIVNQTVPMCGKNNCAANLSLAENNVIKPYYFYSGNLLPIKCTCRDHGTVVKDFTFEECGFVKHEVLGGWIHESILSLINENERGLFLRGASDLGGLSLICFDPNEIDLYIEGNYGAVPKYGIKAKYGIVPLYNDVKFNGEGLDISIYANCLQYADNKADRIRGQAFFVCKNHKFCKKCGESSGRLVASTGYYSTANADKGLSIGCAQHHACGFIWLVDNGGVVDGNKTVISNEGVLCKDLITTSTVDFCNLHVCKEESCKKPIIGLNLVDARSEMVRSPYTGFDTESYSNYCLSHACREFLCKNARISTNTTNEDVSADGVYKINFPQYCEIHCNDCGIFKDGVHCGKPVAVAVYEKNGKMNICEDCGGKKGEKIKNLKSKQCSVCISWVLEEYGRKIAGKFVCQGCLEELYEDKDSKRWDAMESLGINSWEELAKEFEKDEYPVDDENKVFTGLPGMEPVESIYEKCDKCGKTGILTETDDGEKLCINCMKSEPAPGDGPYDYDSPDNYVGEYNPSFSGTTDPAQCVHANYPVPNTVQFISQTETTHVQKWTCINCNTEQQQTFEHTFINGVCVCGIANADTEAPTIEILEPANLEDIKGDGSTFGGIKVGATVRIRVLDNIALKSITYKRFWGENQEEVTQEFQGGTAQDILIGELPAEEGTYTLLIKELTDAAGNKLENKNYIFEIKSAGESTEKPKIQIASINIPETVIADNTSLRFALEGNEIVLILSDVTGLNEITYKCLWLENDNWETVKYEGSTMETLRISDIGYVDTRVLLIKELSDINGNKLQNITLTFDLPSQEEVSDTQKPAIELVSPKDGDVIGNADVRVKFSDNKGLKDVKYVVTTTLAGKNAVSEEKTHDFNYALSEELTVATITTGTTKVVIEFVLTDISGNVTEAKCTITHDAFFSDKVDVDVDGNMFNAETDEGNLSEEEHPGTEQQPPALDGTGIMNNRELIFSDSDFTVKLIAPVNSEVINDETKFEFAITTHNSTFDRVRYSQDINEVRHVSGKETESEQKIPHVHFVLPFCDCLKNIVKENDISKVELYTTMKAMDGKSISLCTTVTIDKNGKIVGVKFAKIGANGEVEYANNNGKLKNNEITAVNYLLEEGTKLKSRGEDKAPILLSAADFLGKVEYSATLNGKEYINKVTEECKGYEYKTLEIPINVSELKGDNLWEINLKVYDLDGDYKTFYCSYEIDGGNRKITKINNINLDGSILDALNNYDIRAQLLRPIAEVADEEDEATLLLEAKAYVDKAIYSAVLNGKKYIDRSVKQYFGAGHVALQIPIYTSELKAGENVWEVAVDIYDLNNEYKRLVCSFIIDGDTREIKNINNIDSQGFLQEAATLH